MPKRSLQPPTPNRLAVPALRLVAERGASAADLARRFGLPEDVLSRSVVEMSTVDFCALLDAAAVVTREPFFGLRLAVAADTRAYGLPDLAALTSPTLRGALERLVRYGRLSHVDVVFALDEAGDEARFTQRLRGIDPEAARHVSDFAVAMMLRTMQRDAGCAITPRRVWFAHQEPENPQVLRDFFGGVAMAFGHVDSGMSIARASLDLPMRGADARLLSTAEGLAEQALASQPEDADFVTLVAGRVRRALEHDGPTAGSVAKLLKMSPRTLQRRLEDAGTSFRAVVDGVRHDLARAYVAEGKLTLSEVAYRTGFAELRAFSRAFKRWTGVVPTAYRRAALGK